MSQSPPHVRVPPPGPRSRALAERLARVESPSVEARRQDRTRLSGEEQAPIVYTRGEGANVFDVDDNRYVDLAAGFGALLLGHRPAQVAAAVGAQSERLWLALGDVYPSDAKVSLCERLAALMPGAGARVLLGTSGADAVTAALKTAVLATGRSGVVAFEGAYHGLSHGPLAACGLRPSFREPFAGQLGTHVRFAPYPADEAALDASMGAVERALSQRDVGAVLVEPILGRGGCVVPPSGFLPSLRGACDRAGALLVCDEIWTGLGRSGAWLSSRDAGVEADIVCLGKGLGGGWPISACIGSGRVMEAWGAHGGSTLHTGTHFGAPVVCAAALAVLDALEQRGLPARARAAGQRWMAVLRERTAGAGARDVRGRGLMVGVCVDGGGPRALAVARKLLARGWVVLTGGTAGDVLTLTPPLDVDEALLSAFADDSSPMSSAAETSDRLHARVRAMVRAFEQGAEPPEGFDELAVDIARFQAEHVEGYARLCAARGVVPDRTSRAAEFPAVPTDAFKVSRVFAFGEADAAHVFRTSGTTTGARGVHAMRTAATYDAAALAFGRVMLAEDLPASSAVVVIGPSSTEAPDSSLAHMCDRFARALGPTASPEHTFFVRGGDLQVEALRARIAGLAGAAPAIVLSTSFALVHLVDALRGDTLPLPPGSRIMQTGGYKGRSREVPEAELRADIARTFAVTERDVVGEYGMTELSSQLWETTRGAGGVRGVYAAPPWVRVTGVDPETLAPVVEGDVGLARIEDLANVDSAVVVLAQDRIRRVAGGVELLGRAPGAPPRGCSIAIDEMLTGGR